MRGAGGLTGSQSAGGATANAQRNHSSHRGPGWGRDGARPGRGRASKTRSRSGRGARREPVGAGHAGNRAPHLSFPRWRRAAVPAPAPHMRSDPAGRAAPSLPPGGRGAADRARSGAAPSASGIPRTPPRPWTGEAGGASLEERSEAAAARVRLGPRLSSVLFLPSPARRRRPAEAVPSGAGPAAAPLLPALRSLAAPSLPPSLQLALKMAAAPVGEEGPGEAAGRGAAGGGRSPRWVRGRARLLSFLPASCPAALRRQARRYPPPVT